MAFDDVPQLVLDATTTAEDRTFWANSGFDAPAIIAAVAEDASGDARARRLDDHPAARARAAAAVRGDRGRLRPLHAQGQGADPGDARCPRPSPARPARSGSSPRTSTRSSTATARTGSRRRPGSTSASTDLAELTPAQAALLAGLPKSPSTLDPYRYAVKDDEGRLVVPPDAPPVVRRDWILDGLAEGARWTKLSPTELRTALAEPVVLAGEQAAHVQGGPLHVAGPSPARRRSSAAPRSRRDRRLQGHHDPRLQGPGARREVADRRRDRPQRLAQEGRRAAEVAQDPEGRPRLDPGPARQGPPQRRAGRARLPDRRRPGLRRQRRLLPRRHDQPEVLAEVRRRGRRCAPARARRSSRSSTPAPSSPRQLTPGSLLLDVTTEFNRREEWAPRDADQLERGPVLVRKALQYSLNIPAIRALERVGNEPVDKTAEALGLRFTGGREAFLQAGPRRRARHRRGPAARPDLGLRRARQRRRPGAAPDDPRDPGARRQGRLEGPGARGHARPSRRRPPTSSPTSWPATPTRRRTRSGPRSWRSTTGRAAAAGRRRSRPARPTTRATWRRTATSRRRRDDQPGPRRRRLDGQQRPLEPALEEAGDLADGGRAAVACLRARLHEGLAGRRLQGARRASSRRRSTPGPAASPARGRGQKTTRLVHRRHAARRAQGDRSRRPALLAGLRRLARRPAQGRARAVELGRATSPTGCAALAAARA